MNISGTNFGQFFLLHSDDTMNQHTQQHTILAWWNQPNEECTIEQPNFSPLKSLKLVFISSFQQEVYWFKRCKHTLNQGGHTVLITEEFFYNVVPPELKNFTNCASVVISKLLLHIVIYCIKLIILLKIPLRAKCKKRGYFILPVF